ncbi:C40 family peptidase [Streptomyces dysideae]|nr:NlpC/P60 family protein [Streptomyces dysideae]
MRNSALASAALTSVALLAQTANAAPSAGDEGPSREEVRQRVSSLYDQAESDTGTFNATRAAATRGRVDRPVDGGRRTDPALDTVARQWFDVARSRLGPTVPAVMPPDRRPDRPAGARPARPAERAGDGRTGGARETADRALPELTAKPVAELTSGPATATAPVAELTAGPVPALPMALPTAPETQQPETSQETPRAQSLALPAPTTEARQSALRTTKEQNRRKLAHARELLSAHVVQQSTPLAAAEPPPVEDTWSATTAQSLPEARPEWPQQQPTELGTVAPVTTGWTTTADQAAATGWSTATGQVIDTGTGTVPVAAQDTRAVRAVSFARAQIGKPSLWGATGPDSYDAGGLVQAAWKAAGVTLPRTPPEQATAGTPVSLIYVEPGDLVLFHAGHVGIATGNGMMIHAPSPGTSIREESIFYAGEAAIHSVIRPA